MRLKGYQFAELTGIVFLLGSTAAQIFYVEPLRREIEWRMATFSMQQNGQIQTRAVYDTHIATLQAMGAKPELVTAAEISRDKAVEKYKTADANIADYLIDKEPVEGMLQFAVVALFALGSLLAGFGRAMEMVAGRRAPD